jgi:cytochrome c oxidase cbb3-type subunit III
MAKPDEPNNPHGRLIDHEYDGIQEYDNPMPRWWLLTFAGTVVFSVVYLFNVGPVGNGKGRIADYEAEMLAAAELAPPAPTAIEPATLLALSKDREALEDGKEVFGAYCASCHGPDGGGVIGPNLTDNVWLHGGAPEAIYLTVNEGVLAKGMPPWGKSLKPEQLTAVTAYVISLQGSTPTNPKAPEGEPYTP